jgi:hypothetical protein
LQLRSRISRCGFGRPQLNVGNCHINAKNYGIYANNCTEATITGNLFYGAMAAIPAGPASRSHVNRQHFFNIVGNIFHNTNVSKTFTAVKIAKGSYGLVDINIFRRATTAILLTSGASNVMEMQARSIQSVCSSNFYGQHRSSAAFRDILDGHSRVSLFRKVHQLARHSGTIPIKSTMH